MQTINDYDKDVFNGDLGFVQTVDAEAQELVLNCDGPMVKYDCGELDELVPAYAITIHKSQGSEYPAVVIPLSTQHYLMLRRNLINSLRSAITENQVQMAIWRRLPRHTIQMLARVGYLILRRAIARSGRLRSEPSKPQGCCSANFDLTIWKRDGGTAERASREVWK
jgi:hypothetical protein